MQKLITYSKIGYNAPSQANWSYGIWKVDCIDTDKSYCISYTVYENFGGDSRFRAMLETHGIKAIETRGVQPTQKVTGIKHMENMESSEFIGKVVDFINPTL